jgi:hypothetical protein
MTQRCQLKLGAAPLAELLDVDLIVLSIDVCVHHAQQSLHCGPVLM